MSNVLGRFLAETADYGVINVVIKSNITLDGTDSAYGVVNKKTNQIEVRCFTMPETLVTLENLQAALDAATGKHGGSPN